MAKKKEPQVSLYADIDESLKRRLERLAEHREQKLRVVLSQALRRFLDTEEKKEGLPPIDAEK